MKNEDANSTIFSLDSLTGHLILNKPLDFEDTKEHDLIVIATDQCINVTERLSSSVTVRVFLNDVNDNSPKFVIPQKPSVVIRRGLTVGMAVTHIIAVDDDSGENGRVTYILSDEESDSFFSLGYDTGILTLVKPLRENRQFYNLNITAMDHGIPPRKTELKLRLNSDSAVNSSPKFLNSVFKATIPEDVAIGTFVTRVSVEMPVQNHDSNLTFLVQSDLTGGAFTIDSQGRITTTSYLDREKQEIYSLPVYIMDSSKSPKILLDVATLLIKVQDVNDHAPEFKSGSCYRLSIPENNEQGVIHTVRATDPDEGLNSQIIYSITGGNVGNKFSVDPKAGHLTAKPLDRESFSRYHLTIAAQDKGSPPMQGFCNLTIFVEDQNDNDPKFDEMKYSRSIKEDIAPDTSILRVHASDFDVGVNSRIIYSLANESQWLFRIDNKTGDIFTAGHFDRERQSVYSF
ncbi:hypothetical protein HHI36_011021 [Cryptolaemus montrouzieri]|uniref:Cadherin domain-containing protein n=1 Tax=Cryptolaemus montrouzieri TaxID=559131 RepID=A0ABD2MKV5_9CUCU